ncbi:MAG: hypothetical protein GY862_03790 [Gammaproteobacteria bacterium]|nr:hypothetical protein [Gammaproteobacteria bacterium]
MPYQSDLRHDPLLRRVFTLAIAEPLYKLCPDAKKAPLDKLDYFSIAMDVIEAVLSSLHLGSMAGRLQREALREQIAEWMNRQLEVLSRQDEIEALPSPDALHKQADEIIDRLLNNKAAAPFSTQIFSYAENCFKTFVFSLLEEGEGRQFFLKPSTECANLYFNALSQSLEDKQVAIQAVLDHQLKAGKIEEAGKTADEHRAATYQHRNEVRNLLHRIRANVRNLDWQTQLQPQIDSALHTHAGRTGACRRKRRNGRNHL